MTDLRVVEYEDPCSELEGLGYPPSLAKACCDPFDYALQLRDGTILHFTSAYAHGAWVNIQFGGFTDHIPPPEMGGFSFERGVDVRVSDIVWCADAPNGS